MPKGIYPHKRLPLADRFWQHVLCDLATGCWLWTGDINRTHGYGRIALGGRFSQVGAHQAAWLVYHGDFPTRCVLHRCDTPLCVRPDHLFLGTKADNSADMAKKGRGRGADKKTTAAQRDMMRVLADGGIPHKAIAAQFGIHQSTVSHIISQRRKRL